MRASDIISIIFAVVLAGGGIGGFFWWKNETARVETARYEAELDGMLDRKMQSVWLETMAPALASPDDNLVTLRSLYENDAHYDRLNLGFGTLRGDWRTSYANYAEQAGRVVEEGRLVAELDERFGAGAYALMEENYERYLIEAPQRAEEQAARREREAQEMARALADFVRRNGRYPEGAIRLENGRIVEE